MCLEEVIDKVTKEFFVAEIFAAQETLQLSVGQMRSETNLSNCLKKYQNNWKINLFGHCYFERSDSAIAQTF